jgi:superfamily II DNA or RNA helicase
MEYASFMSLVSQAENRLGDQFRKGQRDVAEQFLNSTAVIAQLPTGYGKTRAAALSYAVLRAASVCNRILYIVPRGGQATQAAEDLPRDLSALLSPLFIQAQIVGDTPIPAIKAHRSGACEIFIVTIQSLVAGGSALTAVRDMMQTGKWLIVIDEYHHYGDSEKAWTLKIRSLPHQALLAMSATPYRQDRSDTFGPPHLSIRYREARELGYLKKLDLHAYDYRVDATVDNRDVESFTTSEIYKEVGSNLPDAIDRWAAVKELRWSPRYVSPLVKRPVARLMSYPFRAQMIVQAISCSHAKMVCEQIKALVGPDINVDWVGTGPRGRSDAENIKILKEFCPVKNSKGVRPWTLDILVNVGMAGEGTDCIDVCEIIFLNAPNLNNSTLQVIGRAARPLKHTPSSIAIINVDEACEMAQYVGDAVETCFDEVAAVPKDSNGGGGNGGGDYPLPPDVKIKDTTDLVDIRTDPHFAPALKKAMAHPSTQGMARAEIEQIVEELLREGLRRRDAVFNQSAEILRQKRRVENGCRLKAFQIQGMLQKTGRLQLVEFQDIIKRIKSRKNRDLRSTPDDCSVEELARHMTWLEQLQQQLTNGLPPWLT